MGNLSEIEKLDQRIIRCQRCPRLREYCQQIAQIKRAAFKNQTYWGKPVPNLTDKSIEAIAVLIVGLAPAAHGANRTGRMFTGDRSGDFLFRSLYETGFANMPISKGLGDGFELRNIAITASAHCAPPDNKPTRQELENCEVHLRDTFAALPQLRVVVCLGQIGHQSVMRLFKKRGCVRALADYPFSHGAEHTLQDGPTTLKVLDSYHPSQQNTFTGRLTRDMFNAIFLKARGLAHLPHPTAKTRNR